MSTAISWVFEAAIKPDGVDDYRALGREITADNEAAEPGQMIFEWFIDDQVVRQNSQRGECLKMSNNQPADSSHSNHSHSQPAEPSTDAPIPNSLPQFPVRMRPLPEERQHLSDCEFRDGRGRSGRRVGNSDSTITRSGQWDIVEADSGVSDQT